MRIALVAYEYDGVASGGGIGTYVRNVARMLADAGYHVAIFAGGETSAVAHPSAALSVYHVGGPRETFVDTVVPVFAKAHHERPFDVVEGPEYGADASGIAARFPELPLVVKLHAPSFSILEANRQHIPWSARMRFAIGGLLRGRLSPDPWRYDSRNDRERLHALQADLVVGNSRATADLVAAQWHLAPERLSALSMPYAPTREVLEIAGEPDTPTILFLGRIEVRKGVLDLARAIPLVKRRHTDARFRFVGRDLPHPADRRPLSDHIRRLAGRFENAVEIPGAVDYDRVPSELAGATVCVFPSTWEAAGLVCLEAMAAARPVIGSSSGGMAEFIEPGVTGLLVPPFAARRIAESINALLDDPAARRAMGAAARTAVLSKYAPAQIAGPQVATYVQAIANAAKRPPGRRWGG